MTTRHPSEITPAFTTERLRIVADVITRVRRDALEVYQPENGDNAWNFGCTCYSRTIANLAWLEESQQHGWLRIEMVGLACTILIEGEPIKFYRGDAEHPSDRSLRRGLDQAILQGKLAFLDDEHTAEIEGWFWLMAIETHEDGTVARIAVLQANRAGDVRNQWFVPLDEGVAVATSATKPVREGRELPPPAVSLKPVKTETDDDDDGDDGGGSK